jgi:hypothetical protein
MIDEGWTPRQVRRRQARGRWRPVVGRVLSAAADPSPALTRPWAAQLLWPDAVFRSADRSAAVAGAGHGRRPGTRDDVVGWLRRVPAGPVPAGCAGCSRTLRRARSAVVSIGCTP